MPTCRAPPAMPAGSWESPESTHPSPASCSPCNTWRRRTPSTGLPPRPAWKASGPVPDRGVCFSCLYPSPAAASLPHPKSPAADSDHTPSVAKIYSSLPHNRRKVPPPPHCLCTLPHRCHAQSEQSPGGTPHPHHSVSDLQRIVTDPDRHSPYGSSTFGQLAGPPGAPKPWWAGSRPPSRPAPTVAGGGVVPVRWARCRGPRPFPGYQDRVKGTASVRDVPR